MDSLKKLKEFFACAKLMGEKNGEITALKADLSYWKELAAERIACNLENVALKAEVEKLREALKRIRDWPYDIMGDCVYDARKEAEDALKEATNG